MCSRSVIGKLWPIGQIPSAYVFANKGLLEQSHAHYSFKYYLLLVSHNNSKDEKCSRDHIFTIWSFTNNIDKNTYYVAFYRKSLLIPVLYY